MATAQMKINKHLQRSALALIKTHSLGQSRAKPLQQFHSPVPTGALKFIKNTYAALRQRQQKKAQLIKNHMTSSLSIINDSSISSGRWRTRGLDPGELGLEVWKTRDLVENTGSEWKTPGLSGKRRV